MGCCTRECGLIAGAVFGAAVAILGGVLIPLGNSIIEKTVEKVRCSVSPLGWSIRSDRGCVNVCVCVCVYIGIKVNQEK